MRGSFITCFQPSSRVTLSGHSTNEKTTVVTPAAQRGALDNAVLEALSTDEMRQQAARRAVQALARQNPARARELLDRYVTDPAVRAEIEAQAELAPAR